MQARSLTLRRDGLVAALAIAGGLLFFASLDVLWPLVDVPLLTPTSELRGTAVELLSERGFDVERFEHGARLTVDWRGLEYVEETFGRDATRRWIRQGLSLVEHRVTFKRAGEPRALTAWVHPTNGAIGWWRVVEEDDPGARISLEAGRQLAREALVGSLGLELGEWEEKSAGTTDRPERTDHWLTFERTLSVEPELRERVVCAVSGDEVTTVERYVVVPGPARRERRAAEAPGRATEAVGILLLVVAAAGGFWVFLTRLRDGTARLGRSAALAGIAFALLVATWRLQTASLLEAWEPLWPRWVSDLTSIVQQAAGQLWMGLVLLALIAAGDALDRELGAARGASLWRLLRGEVASAPVGRASLRGFLIGLLCGGVMAGAVIALQHLAGATTSLQPRGFFFYALNSASPAVATLLFFLNVALLEELGYRFFCGSWLLRLGGARWVAILLPALIYGLTHTRLDFLPPAEPFWARPLVLTLVGCVWGWAFLRYDALTVVLSHWTADLFIFNWPRLASGEPTHVTAAVVTIAVPLLPALLFALRRLRSGF